MAKVLTTEQAQKLNKKLGNNFRFDIVHYMAHGEKTAIQLVEIEPGVYVRLRLSYFPEYEHRLSMVGQSQFEHGVPFKECNGYNARTGREIPVCHVSVLYKQETALVSYGVGRFVKIGEAQNRKTYSTIEKLSNTIKINDFIELGKRNPNIIEKLSPLFL